MQTKIEKDHQNVQKPQAHERDTMSSRYVLVEVSIKNTANKDLRAGRTPISWLKNLRILCSKTTTELFSAADNNVVISRMDANIRE